MLYVHTFIFLILYFSCTIVCFSCNNHSYDLRTYIVDIWRMLPHYSRLKTIDTEIIHAVLLHNFKLFQTPIVASIYTSGRDESNFSRANEFLPYRWDRNDPRKQDLANHVSSASLPFALGARSCVGKKIAMIQLTEITQQVNLLILGAF